MFSNLLIQPNVFAVRNIFLGFEFCRHRLEKFINRNIGVCHHRAFIWFVRSTFSCPLLQLSLVVLSLDNA